MNTITDFKLTDNTHQMLFFLIVISLHHLPLITLHTNIVATNYSMTQVIISMAFYSQNGVPVSFQRLHDYPIFLLTESDKARPG